MNLALLIPLNASEKDIPPASVTLLRAIHGIVEKNWATLKTSADQIALAQRASLLFTRLGDPVATAFVLTVSAGDLPPAASRMIESIRNLLAGPKGWRTLRTPAAQIRLTISGSAYFDRMAATGEPAESHTAGKTTAARRSAPARKTRTAGSGA